MHPSFHDRYSQIVIVYDNTLTKQNFPKYLGDCPLSEGVHYKIL